MLTGLCYVLHTVYLVVNHHQWIQLLDSSTPPGRHTARASEEAAGRSHGRNLRRGQRAVDNNANARKGGRDIHSACSTLV